MKYSLTERLDFKYLSQAEEIIVEYRNRRGIPDLAQKYPNATIILQFIPSQIEKDINWNEIEEYNILCEEDFICCVSSYTDAKTCKNKNIKFYFGYPIESFFELRKVKELGACYARLGPELFFDLPAVAKVGVPVRLTPNVSSYLYLSGPCGQWVRPEDLYLYEPYVSVIEFEDANPEKEAAFYRIYTKDGWSGDLNALFTNFDAHGVIGRLIPAEVIAARLKCRHRCQRTGDCRLCEFAFKFADKDRLKEYAENHNLI